MKDSRHSRRGKVSGRLLVWFGWSGLAGSLVLSGCNHWEAETPAKVSAMIQVPIWVVWQRVSLRMECRLRD